MKATSDFILSIWRNSEPLVVGALLGIVAATFFHLGYGTKKLRNGRSKKEPVKPASDKELLS